MTGDERSKSIAKITDDPSVTVMLVSLKSGGVGLNLTAACRVIIEDLWWNPAVEDRLWTLVFFDGLGYMRLAAIDRVHRIGQTSKVEVWRLVVQGTVEERILSIQDRKRQIVSGSLGEGDLKLERLTIEDLRYLFGQSDTESGSALAARAAEAESVANAMRTLDDPGNLGAGQDG
eukprot:jgi/Hompol1/2486/HPOL_006044-RA